MDLYSWYWNVLCTLLKEARKHHASYKCIHLQEWPVYRYAGVIESWGRDQSVSELSPSPWAGTHSQHCLGSLEPESRQARDLGENQIQLFCLKNVETKWLLTTFCCIYRSVPCSAIIRDASSCIRDPQLKDKQTLAYWVLKRMSPSNSSSQGSGNSVEEEVERVLRAKGNGVHQGIKAF